MRLVILVDCPIILQLTGTEFNRENSDTSELVDSVSD